MDCRELLDVKQYEFLLNYYLRVLKQENLAALDEPLSYDGFSHYDQAFYRISEKARLAFIEAFSEPPPPIALTNLFHLAELELAGVRNRPKAPKTLM